MAKWLRRPLSKREIASSILAKSIPLFLLRVLPIYVDANNDGVCYFKCVSLIHVVVLQVFFFARVREHVCACVFYDDKGDESSSSSVTSSKSSSESVVCSIPPPS